MLTGRSCVAAAAAVVGPDPLPPATAPQGLLRPVGDGSFAPVADAGSLTLDGSGAAWELPLARPVRQGDVLAVRGPALTAVFGAVTGSGGHAVFCEPPARPVGTDARAPDAGASPPGELLVAADLEVAVPSLEVARRPVDHVCTVGNGACLGATGVRLRCPVGSRPPGPRPFAAFPCVNRQIGTGNDEVLSGTSFRDRLQGCAGRDLLRGTAG